MKKVTPLVLAALLGIAGGCETEQPSEGNGAASRSPNEHDQASPVERGRYLVDVVAGCPTCHTPVDSSLRPIPSMRLAGGFEFADVFGTWRSPNITQDRKTGIGDWTDEQIMAAIREGRRPNGGLLYVIMPYLLYNRLSDADARGMVAYLRTIPAVENVVAPNTDLRLPKVPAPRPSGEPPPPEDQLKTGEYLATLMVCVDCHTPMAPDGSPDTTRAYAGGVPFQMPPAHGAGVVWSPNITPDEETGIGYYTEEQIITAITRMEKADGSPIYGPMTLLQDGWSKLEHADAIAVARYFKSLAPIKNRVPASTFEPAEPRETQ